MELINSLYEEMAALSWVDWTATITALLYVGLAARANSWCWFWGIISCSLWAYASYFFYDLYLDALLQLFYVVMAFVGLYNWKRGGEGQEQEEKAISRVSTKQHALYIIGGTVLAIVFGYVFSEYTPAAATYWDAFTTIFSVLATFMLVQKQLDNWLYWIVIDAIYTGLYFSRGAYLFTILMIIYTIIAMFAFLKWRKLLLKQI